MSFIQSIKKNKKNSNHSVLIGRESEIETLQNALHEAMLREKQLIQEKAQREDEMKQQRDASKQYIAVLMKEKQALEDKIGSETIDTMNALHAEAEENKKDLERVLQKLAQREHEHNQFEDEIMSLKKALKESQSQLKHSRFDETQTLLTSITTQLKEATQKNKILENEKENLKDELTSKLTELTELNQTISHLNVQNTKYNRSIHELSTKLEDITTTGKQQMSELAAANSQLKKEIEAVKNEQSTATNEWVDRENGLNNEMMELNSEITHWKNENESLQNELNTQIESKNATINELEIACKIREKKKNKLVREYKEQLKREVIKSQELKCKVLKLNDELIGKQYSGDNVNTALAKKLETQVKSNFDLKEQIKYLTECIQQLHIDLDNKKTVIANITKRIDIGAIPTKRYAKTTNDKDRVFQLQLLTQETTLQNAMLRKDIKLMGNALQESQNKIKTLQNLNK
eukprot:25889_1